MRVITGSAKGRRLITLDGDDVRPTTDKVKEGIFSTLHFYLEGRQFLDLFAGSGQMGIEAISRGAKSATFVDASRKSIKVITENVRNVGFSENAKILNMDAKSFLSLKGSNFDIAFLDPPYRCGLVEECLEPLEKIMNKTGIIVCETPVEEVLPEKINEFVVNREYKYGKIKVTTYCHGNFKE